MGTDGRDQQVPRRRLHNGAAGRHGVAGGAGGRGDHHTVAGDFGKSSFLCKDIQPYNPCHRTFRHNSVVERNVAVHRVAAPENGHIQHHAGLYHEIPALQIPQTLQLVGLQLRHETETAQIDAQHRYVVQCRRAAQVQDGPVAAKGDHQVGALDLLLQLPHRDAQFIPVAVPMEGQAHHRFKADALQDRLGVFGHFQLAVPIGIRAQDHFLFHCASPSFNVSWDAVTTARRSMAASGSSDLRRYPKYSIFPSGPRMGEYVTPRTAR